MKGHGSVHTLPGRAGRWQITLIAAGAALSAAMVAVALGRAPMARKLRTTARTRT